MEKIWAFGEPGQSLKSRMKRDKKEKMELDELNHLLVSLQLRSDEPNTAINQSAVFAAPVSSYMSVLERTKKKKNIQKDEGASWYILSIRRATLRGYPHASTLTPFSLAAATTRSAAVGSPCFCSNATYCEARERSPRAQRRVVAEKSEYASPYVSRERQARHGRPVQRPCLFEALLLHLERARSATDQKSRRAHSPD